MNALTIVAIVALVLVVAAVGFVVVRQRQRSGSVLAAPDKSRGTSTDPRSRPS